MTLPEPRRGWARALLVGVPRFDREGLPDVPGIHRAPFEVRAALTGRDGGGVFRTQDVHVAIPDAANDLWRELGWAVAGADRLDLLLVHYTGPAEFDAEVGESGKLYLTVGRRVDEQEFTSRVAVNHLIDVLRESGAAQVVLILDCPSAGSAIVEAGVWRTPFHLLASTPRDRAVRWLNTARGGRLAGQRLPVFTRRLVQALLPASERETVTMEMVVDRLRASASRAGDDRHPVAEAFAGGGGITVNRRALWGDSGSWAFPADLVVESPGVSGEAELPTWAPDAGGPDVPEFVDGGADGPMGAPPPPRDPPGGPDSGADTGPASGAESA